MLLRNGNEFGIIYATYLDNPGFQRFSIAHEIGHLMLPGHCDQILGDCAYHESRAGFKSYDSFELQADFYASGLLMPSHLLRPVLITSKEGLDTVKAISDSCETSLTASAIRYTKITDSIAAIVVSEGGKINYCFMSDALKDLDNLQWIKKHTSIPDNTITKKFNEDADNILSAESTESTSHIQDWFGSDYDLELVEEVVGLGNYGKTLTVLYTEDNPEDLEKNEDLPGMDDLRFRGKHE